MGPEIITWLAGSGEEEETLQYIQRKVLMDGDSMVWVHAKHLLDGHWKLSAFNIVLPEEDEEMSEFPQGDAGLNPALAVAHIAGSADRLLRTGTWSARLTQSRAAGNPITTVSWRRCLRQSENPL